jgi:hypothetical protein
LLPEAEVTQDALDHGWAVDQRNNPHLLLAFRALFLCPLSLFLLMQPATLACTRHP